MPVASFIPPSLSVEFLGWRDPPDNYLAGFESEAADEQELRDDEARMKSSGWFFDDDGLAQAAPAPKAADAAKSDEAKSEPAAFTETEQAHELDIGEDDDEDIDDILGDTGGWGDGHDGTEL
eukprot:TRINITY_DN54_c0_g1_i2.p1 TRINITY_DN54_c0_g1~~TRINITY_DN54_c0_g1_i2.p1  ORF type:complete len:122 (-),score=36.36 TRINITY_DN54_c0_g1_i2:80-445(-)